MDEALKKEAMDKFKKMFDKFDIDNQDHAAIFLMYDKKEGDFRMLTLNTTPGVAMAMLDSATDSLMECINDSLDDDRTLN